MKEENSFDRLAKQIQDDIKGLTELSGRLVELDKEERKVHKMATWTKLTTAIALVIAVIVIAWAILA